MSDFKKKRIAWFVPGVHEGSGGERTIFHNMECLEKRGYECDLYVEESENEAGEIRNIISEKFGIKMGGNVYVGRELKKEYDMAVATFFTSAKLVKKTKCKHKMYFIQDYAPWFFPMSAN